MPSRNTVKQYDSPAYYHVYNRGAGGQLIFLDTQDKRKFLSFLARYLTSPEKREEGDKSYPFYDAELIAYCLMRNHFHLLVFQENDPSSISGLMRSVATSYTMYFNRRYKQQGHLFQSIFKASRINDESYLLHITRYIHMNPRTYMTYCWSSLRAYLGEVAPPTWLHADRALDMPPEKYRDFLEDYESKKVEHETLKHELAD